MVILSLINILYKAKRDIVIVIKPLKTSIFLFNSNNFSNLIIFIIPIPIITIEMRRIIVV
jgi:hypothetical protein